jgi:hypothetical protein
MYDARGTNPNPAEDSLGREKTASTGGVWKLRVAAPPVDGRAKTVEIEGVEARELNRAILESHGSETHTGSAAAK